MVESKFIMDNAGNNPQCFDQHELSEDENVNCFVEDILPFYSKQIYSVPFPRIAIVGGQPGSGKSFAIKILKGKLGLEFLPVTIDKDELALSHPKLSEIQKFDNLHMSEYTNADANKWKRYLLKLCEISKSNVIFEHALQKREFIEETIRQFKESSFGVDLHCLAVNSKISIQNIILRYAEREFIRPNSGRIVFPGFHHEAYVAYPAIAQYFQDQKLVDTISVYSRNDTLFKNALNNGNWEKPERVEFVIGAERNRIWTQEEKNNLADGWNKLEANWKAFIREHKAPPFPKEIYNKARPFIQEARLFAKAVQAECLTQFGIVAKITPHHIFVLTENEMVAFDRSPLEKPKFHIGDAWSLKSKPAARTVGGRFKPNALGF